MKTPSDALLMEMTTTLTRMARVYRGVADQMLADLGLSQATAWPIVLIGRLGDGVRQRPLAEELGIEASSLVRLLDQLEASGYVQRKDDSTDRRAKTLHLTEAGKALTARVESLLVDVRRQLFDGVSEADAQAFLRVFAQLKTHCEAARREPAEPAGPQ
ncbi:MarR family transcriptional regulator [Pigmentiphaga soli]|uniref:MarR family transcriptional regulator n=1 Tax=Pigmentiphaga soli TaxID=1007095 RepID=A0ABP8HQL4_9BURK